MHPSPKQMVGLTFRMVRQRLGAFVAGTLILSLVITAILVLTAAAFIAMIAPASQLFIPAGSPVERVLAFAPLGQFPGATLFLLFGPLILGLSGVYLKAYNTLLAVEPQRSTGSLLGRTFGLVLPFIALSFWIFLRAYLWVPMILGMVVGMVQAAGLPAEQSSVLTGMVALFNAGLALWFIPRLMFAPVVYLRDHVTIHQSIAVSLKRTQGKWGAIVSNLALSIVLNMVIGFILGFCAVLFFWQVPLAPHLSVLGLAIFFWMSLFLLVVGVVNIFIAVLGLSVTAQEEPQGPPVETPGVVGEA